MWLRTVTGLIPKITAYALRILRGGEQAEHRELSLGRRHAHGRAA
jgi:hypothetical protein